jgi:hypothetical protein
MVNNFSFMGLMEKYSSAQLTSLEAGPMGQSPALFYQPSNA